MALSLLPVGMAIAHRSSPVFLTIAALLCAAATIVEGKVTDLLGRMWRVLSSPPGVAVVVALAWCILSLGWSGAPLLTLRMLGEFWLSVLAGFVVFHALPGHLHHRAYLGLALGLAGASLIILVDFWSGLAVRAAIGVRSFNFIHNRPALTALLGLIPLLTFAVLHPREISRIVLGLAILGVLGVVVLSESGAARLGALVALVTVIAARASLRVSAVVLALGLAAAIMLSPVTGHIAETLIPAALHDALADSNSRARVYIWNSFGAAVAVQPWHGAGFGTSARVGDFPVAAEVAPEFRQGLSDSHAHNAALQIWVELGLPGAVAALAVVLLLIRRISRRDGLFPAVQLAMIAAVAAVSLVGHGAWQGWWASSVAASLVWLQGLRVREQEAIR